LRYEIHPNMRSSLDESAPQVDWRPDWLPSAQSTPSTARVITTPEHLQPQSPASGFDSYRLSNVSNGRSSISGKVQTVEEEEEAEQIPSALPDDELVIERNRDRAVKYASTKDHTSNAFTDLVTDDVLEEYTSSYVHTITLPLCMALSLHLLDDHYQQRPRNRSLCARWNHSQTWRTSCCPLVLRTRRSSCMGRHAMHSRDAMYLANFWSAERLCYGIRRCRTGHSRWCCVLVSRIFHWRYEMY
jgi:hypothetical protein